MLLEHFKNRVWRRVSGAFLVKQIEHDRLVNRLFVKVVVHDKDSTVRQEHHALKDILESLVDPSALVSDNLACSRLQLTLLGNLLSARPQRVWFGLRTGLTRAVCRDLDPTISHAVRLGHGAITALRTCACRRIALILFAKDCSIALACNAAIEICDYTRFERENAMVLKPEEHDLLKVGLSRLEEVLEFVLLRQLDDFEDLT